MPFLKLAESLADSVGHDSKPYKKQLSELRYSGVKTDRASSLLDVIRYSGVKTDRVSSLLDVIRYSEVKTDRASG